ncbi:hypothetical protein CIPAW_01G029900 [Carya illinoinensis]|uniref:Uncharacterized protein n=1 Tax=Carya illinoinensis TaxID=32201 RepID=A0A8T1RHD6_CARIL|nr:hypothetical protein CIPAW_01G029900 [Carya illinoinensis]
MRANATHKCEVCSYEFQKSSKSALCKKRNSVRFCSLACKAKSMMDLTNADGCARTEVLIISTLTANGGVLQFCPKTNDTYVPARNVPRSHQGTSMTI